MTRAADRTDVAEARGNSIERHLRTAWRKETAFHLTRGLCTFFAWGVVLAAADFFLDWFFDLPGYARAVLLAVNVGVLGYVAYTRGLRHLRRFGEVRQALRVERAHESLESLLVSYVQLREEEPSPGVSPTMIRLARREAAERAGGLDFGRVVDFARLRRVLIVAVCLVAVFVGAGAVRPGFLRALGSRMLNPFSTVAYPTRTHLESLTGDMVVRQAEAVSVRARATGEVEEAGTLRVRMAGGGWEEVGLRGTLATQDGAEACDFEHLFRWVYQNFDYQFRVGDAKGPVHHVTVVAPPRIVEVSVELRYPAYTGREAEEVWTLNLKVPEETEVTWRLRMDRPLGGAALLREDADDEPLDLEEDGRVIRATAEARASSSYRFQFHWRIGDREYIDEGTKHFIQVVPDAAPRAGLVYPVQNEKATLNRTLSITYWAQDDYGLAESWLVYAINDGEERRHPLGSLGDATSVERDADLAVKETIPDLREGDLVTYAIEVSDSRGIGEGLQRGRSKSRRIQFVSEAEYLAYVADRRQKYLRQVRPLYLQELEAGEHIQALEEQEP